ncbi:hypothetical protein evm_009213 [Chilo suppressalis]|nr:hypothetical protein evm_009213 [Chilo suppressalis]
MIHNSKTLLLIKIIFITVPVRSLQLTKLQVPANVPLGERVHLSCSWQLGPRDVLYSVKWYKDGKEFFRYVPKNQSPLRKFALPGIKITESDSSGGNLTLSADNLEASGRYRCEISGEKPSFPTVSKHADMKVIILPDRGPVLLGFLTRYRVGDRLITNCTSGRSRPPTDLTWYINGELATLGHPLHYEERDGGLTVTKSTLELEVKDSYFKGNRLNLKCLATLHPIYWKSVEESAIKERSLISNKLNRFPRTDYVDEVNSAYKIRNYKTILLIAFLNVGKYFIEIYDKACRPSCDCTYYDTSKWFTGVEGLAVVANSRGLKNDGKFETPGKTGKADQRKKWSHKEPWPDAFSEDASH